MALSPRQPLNGQRVLRISGPRQCEERRSTRLATANVGTMKGRGREVVEMMARRRVDIACLQEVRYKGQGARVLGGGERYKFWWSGGERGERGVGILVKEEHVEDVIEVVRIDDRLMKIQMVWGKKVVHVFSVYAPQQGRPEEEKRNFQNKLSDCIEDIPESDIIIVAGDMNSHVGEDRTGFEDVIGGYGWGVRNSDGEEMLRLCQEHNLRVTNTYFKKKKEHLITYKSGDLESQIDYIMYKRCEEVEVKNCKVIPGEECLTQHRLVCADLIMPNKTKKRKRMEKRVKVWKLKEEDKREEFEQRLNERLNQEDYHNWDEVRNKMMGVAKEVCGETRGGRQKERETWWWNNEVQDAIKEKKRAFKIWQRDNTEENKRSYREKANLTKRKVAAAKEQAWREWSEGLHREETVKSMFKIAKQMKKEGQDINGARVLKDENGNMKVKEEEIMHTWKEYYHQLLNEENESQYEEGSKVEGPIKGVTKEEIRKALKEMKKNKAPGPSEVTSELLKGAGDTGEMILGKIYSKIEEEDGRVPEQWGESYTIPIYKEKGDAQLCKNYRGVRLLEHSMKIWEKILLARLWEIVEIEENQLGYQRDKSTIDGIFILRQLQERYGEKKKLLYHIFVDLEKAFDRIPRRMIEWALRRKMVPERLVKLVMGLYRNSRSRVKAVAGISGEFNIGVGVHQGSALSPLLFVIVMGEVTKEVRGDAIWQMLYADDLVLTAESEERAVEMFEEWKRGMEMGGLRVNRSKTKMMVSGIQPEVRQQRGRYPCGVCGEGVGVNSVWCSGCSKWCHGRCSGVRNVRRAGENFRCPACVRGPIVRRREVEVEGGLLEVVDRFCYLGDTVGCEGGAETAVRARVTSAWRKWRELANLLVNQGIPMSLRGRIYCACIRPVLMYASETWALTKKLEKILSTCDHRMLRYMAGVRWGDRVSNEEVRRRCGVENIGDSIRKARLRWFGHVRRREQNNILRRAMNLEVEGRRPVGGPRKTWRKVVEDDMTLLRITEREAEDREEWRRLIARPTPATGREGR